MYPVNKKECVSDVQEKTYSRTPGRTCTVDHPPQTEIICFTDVPEVVHSFS